MRPSSARSAAVLVLALGAGGCAFNLGCELFGSLLQARLPAADVCSSFNGECCGDPDADGLLDECTGFFGFPPCARFDTAACFCTASGDFAARGSLGATRLPAAFTLPPDAFVVVSPPVAGLPAAHRAVFEAQASTLQTARAVVAYPDAFTFAGFLAPGPAGTQVGAYGVDFDHDVTDDLTLPLRSLDADTAYVDGNLNGRHDAADPLVVHTAGSHVFTTTLPRGGDGLAATKLGRVTLRISVALWPGVLANPATPGPYAVSGTFTSVDPDSGDADDGAGTPPTSFAATPMDVAIAPSPNGTLSPFLCWATKPSKGALCAATAAANAGGACATDADCGGTPGACAKKALAKDLAAAVEDDLDAAGPRTFAVKKGTTLCAPAAVDGGGPPADAAAHLRGYQVKAAKGTPPHEPLRALTVANALGTVIVDTKKPDRLLVATAVERDAPAPPLGPTAVDDFKCYPVKVLKKRCAQHAGRKCKRNADCGVDGPCLTTFPKKRTAEAEGGLDGSGAARTLTIVKPTRLCLSADVDGRGVTNLAAALLCYQTKPAPGTAKHATIVGRLHTTNPLARERVDGVKDAELCLPSVSFASVT